MTATVFSFFSGAGFLDLGFEKAGYEIAFVNEYHQPFMDAYKYSRKVMQLPAPRFGYETASIENIDRKLLLSQMDEVRKEGRLVGFVGGPPCPDFSVGGKNRGQKGENGKLSRVYAELVCETIPDFFLFENVKGLYRTKKHREFFESLKKMLCSAGFSLHERVINAIEYGAPQDRERIILIGFKNQDLPKAFDWSGRVYPDRSAFEYDWPTTQPFVVGNDRPMPNDIPLNLTVQYWFQKNQVSLHPNAGHCFKPRAGLSRFLTVDEGDDSRKSYKRLHRWRYSPTAAYGNNEVHLHPSEARRISISEALAIQSLPREFELPNEMSLSNMFKTVGNGVPYLAALGLATSIQEHLGKSNETDSTEPSKGNQQSAA